VAEPPLFTDTPLTGRHIAVVGAGIAGSALALLAARAGARVTLFEAAPEPRTAGAGILLQPNGLAVLDGLGLGPALERAGRAVTHLRIADAAGEVLLDAPVPRFADGLDHGLVLRRRDLLAVLVDAVRAHPLVTCRFGEEVQDVAADGTVAVGPPGDRRALTAELVVGADGVYSRVRKRGRFAATVGRGVWYVRGLGPAVPVDTLTEHWTPLGIFGVAPLDGATYFYASASQGDLAEAIEQRDFEHFRRTWTAVLPVAGDVLADIARFDELVVNQVIRVDCARWVDGRLVLVGDAAHAMAPNLGQGAGSALVDAAVLAWALGETPDQDRALADYERERRAGVRPVQDLAGRLATVSEIGLPGLRHVRDAAVRLLAGWLGGELAMRLAEQVNPLWMRTVARGPDVE
jgi:2-polyprenyl-6-methoxyphenol hydroxylase-like FAD-dependent oxidoreductase